MLDETRRPHLFLFFSFRMVVFARWTRVSSVRGLWVTARPLVVSAQRTQHDLELLASISCYLTGSGL